MSSISAAFKQAKQEIKDHVSDVIRNAALEAINVIVFASPVWSGAYVKSHRLSINGSPVAKAIESPFRIGPKMSKFKADLLRIMVRKKLQSEYRIISPFQLVVIKNEAKHCLDVEYLGSAKYGAHYVYTSADDYFRSKGRALTTQLVDNFAPLSDEELSNVDDIPF
jgi:hypothetical protein